MKQLDVAALCALWSAALIGCHHAQPAPANPNGVRLIVHETWPRPCTAPSCSPLFIIDDEPLDPMKVPANDTTRDPAKRFTPLDPEEVDSIRPVRGAEAVRLYGKAGANGVILVWTKRAKRPVDSTSGPASVPERVPPSASVPVPGSAAIRPGPAVASVPNAPRVECTTRCRPGVLPLFVVDGVIVGHHLPGRVAPALIDTVFIRGAADAAAGYGELGRNGVVEIRMLPRDEQPVFALPDTVPLSPPQAATVCGTAGRRAPMVVIDGFALRGDASVESKWTPLRWDEVLRRDHYSPEEAMADFGKAGRWGADVYTTTYAGVADSSIRRRPPTRIIIRGASLPQGAMDGAPLWIVDGVVFASEDAAVRAIEPEDVEAIVGLGCFDAVMRHGRRARDGAIVVTLKPGRPVPRPATKKP